MRKVKILLALTCAICLLISMALPVSAESAKITIQSVTLTDSTGAAVNEIENLVLENMYDGNYETRSNTNLGQKPYTYTIDLGSVYAVDKVSVYWFISAGNPRAFYYKVLVSANGTDYTQVIDRTSNTVEGTVTDEITAVNARYVQLVMTGDSKNAGFSSIYEVDIFGGEASTSNPQTGGECVILAASALVACITVSFVLKKRSIQA